MSPLVAPSSVIRLEESNLSSAAIKSIPFTFSMDPYLIINDIENTLIDVCFQHG